jgi:hypothetical protein
MHSDLSVPALLLLKIWSATANVSVKLNKPREFIHIANMISLKLGTQLRISAKIYKP